MVQKHAKLFSVTVPLAWGMSYLFMALGASEIPAIELVALRCGLAFLALVLIFYRHLKETFSWKLMAYSAFVGILLFAVFYFLKKKVGRPIQTNILIFIIYKSK